VAATTAHRLAVIAAAVRTRARVLGVAIALFGILVGLAMTTYRGGSRFDPLTTRYELWANYLSDLGRATTYAGQSNALPRALFASGTIVVGGALAWSAPAWRAWNGARRAGSAADVTLASAVLAGIGFAAIGLVPQDRLLGLHNFVVDGAFGMLLVFLAALTVVQVRNHAPRALWITNVGTLAVLAADAVFVLGAGVNAPSTLRFQIAAQKVAVGIALLDVVLQAAGLAARPADRHLRLANRPVGRASRRAVRGAAET
jgi:hypothetical membrane protein